MTIKYYIYYCRIYRSVRVQPITDKNKYNVECLFIIIIIILIIIIIIINSYLKVYLWLHYS